MKKEMLIDVLKGRGFERKDRNEAECYVNEKGKTRITFFDSNVVIQCTPEIATGCTIVCDINQVHYYEMAIEHNTASECYLEVAFSEDSKIRFLPSWYKQ